MPANVEIKARVHDIEIIKKKAAKLCNSSGALLKQKDTFFCVPNGRLKLRSEQEQPDSQLIFYKRDDIAGPKVSEYNITIVQNSKDLLKTLGAAVGIKGQVIKNRWFYIVGQTRLHIDEVQGLGNFMELEVQLREGQSVAEGEEIARDLQAKLGVQNEDLLTSAYIDLLNGS